MNSPGTGSIATKRTKVTHATHAREAASKAPKPTTRQFTTGGAIAVDVFSPPMRHLLESGLGGNPIAKAGFRLKNPGDEGTVRRFAPDARTSVVAVWMLKASELTIRPIRALGFRLV